MLDKEEPKASEEEIVKNTESSKEEIVENIESSKEEKENTLEKTKKEQKTEETTLKETEKKEKIEEKEHRIGSLSKEKISFLTYFKEGIKNTLGTFIVSIGVLAVLALILRYIIGYYLVDIWGMLFIVYLVVSLFYPCIKAKFFTKNKAK